MCSLSGTFSDILFETSVCTVCSSTLRVVLLSQTIERLSHHKLPLAMHYKDRYLWIGLAILIINCMVKNIVRFFWGVSLL